MHEQQNTAESTRYTLCYPKPSNKHHLQQGIVAEVTDVLAFQGCSSTARTYITLDLLVCSPVNKDRVMDAMFNLPRLQLSAEGLPGTPTTLQVIVETVVIVAVVMRKKNRYH